MYRLVLFALALALSASPAAGQTSTQPPARPVAPQPATPVPTQAPFSADARIAFINLQFVFGESALGKQGNDRLRVFSDKVFAGLAAREKEITGLREKIKSQTGLIDESLLKNWTNDLQRLQREAQFAQQEAQVQSEHLQQEVFAEFEKRVLPVLTALRTEKRLHAILSVQSEGGGMTLLSFDPGLDVSSEVVKRLDAAK
ncbi:MAG TPA: OmpH family outer membrane protein [Vicinamibacterales bacterium]|nr:OmpH family outer membrane protein [Vicinamibacterales bacterium]